MFFQLSENLTLCSVLLTIRHWQHYVCQKNIGGYAHCPVLPNYFKYIIFLLTDSQNKENYQLTQTMSTRWYPIYQRGNPQLRVFLPNFWMKLVRPHARQLPNIVKFQCSMEMTKHDIKNYLEKIYNVPVVDVRTKITMGKFRRDLGKGYIIKDDDVKNAFVALPKTMIFEYPDIFGGKKNEDEEHMKSLEEAKKTFTNYINHNKDRPDIPSWFSI